MTSNSTYLPSSISLQQTAHEYQTLIRDGHITSEDLVTSFLDQIDRHNHEGLKVNAILSVCPRDIAISQARTLDEERRQGKIRSDLHGIPIIIKDAIVTDPSLGMITSAGACAIASLKAKRNATVVDRLLDAGIIVLGKGNLTEFCGQKSDNTPIGWSAYGGQTLSPFRREDLKEEDQPWCGGSSVGPAVSIASGFAPLGVGTETGGSNVFPASLNGLYGLTLPLGSVPIDGVSRIGAVSDRLGVMARDPRDIVSLATVLLGHEAGKKREVDDGAPDTAVPFSISEFPTGQDPWKGLSVGILDSEWTCGPESKWKWGSVEVKEGFASVATKLETLGARVVFPLENHPQPNDLQHDGETLHTVAYHEFAGVLEEFIATNFHKDPKLTNLADLVAWNEEHAEQAMPEPYTTQTELIKCLREPITREKHDAALVAIRHMAREESMARYMIDQNLDIVLAPSDSPLIAFTSWAGWPVATVPVGNLTKNSQPWGFFVMSRGGSLDLLSRFMKGFHDSFERVQGPTSPFE